jgi:hypothetical protein
MSLLKLGHLGNKDKHDTAKLNLPEDKAETT